MTMQKIQAPQLGRGLLLMTTYMHELAIHGSIHILWYKSKLTSLYIVIRKNINIPLRCRKMRFMV